MYNPYLPSFPTHSLYNLFRRPQGFTAAIAACERAVKSCEFANVQRDGTAGYFFVARKV